MFKIKKFISILLVGAGMLAYPLDSEVSIKNHNVIQEIPISKQNIKNINSEEQEKSETVYITKNGNCYHKRNCACLKNSKIAVFKNQAIRSNYYACSKCFKLKNLNLSTKNRPL